MEVIAIAAGHAITSVPVKVVAPNYKTDRRTVPKIRTFERTAELFRRFLLLFGELYRHCSSKMTVFIR